MDKGLQIDCLLLDFQKDFDKVPHDLLLDTLNLFRLPDNNFYWLWNYLTGRTQKVVVNGVESSIDPVNSGVSQGSILGPLLCLIYINDIGTGITSNIKLYAGDCALYRKCVDHSAHSALQDALHLTKMEGVLKY